MNSPLPRMLLPATLPMSWCWGGCVCLRNRRFDRGRGTSRLPRPVISVGNLVAGGSGKTPIVHWLVGECLALGHDPAIALRGYGRSPRHYKSPMYMNMGGMSDEEAEYRRLLGEIQVISHPDRHAAVSAHLASHPEIDCLLLDDGFQHRQIHRDLDIVLVDASRPPAGDRLLPAGWLREPPSALARADAVILTHADTGDDIAAREVRHFHGRDAIARCCHAWRSLCLLEGSEDTREVPVEWLAGKGIVLLAGLGNPAHLRRMVLESEARITADLCARDHVHWSRGHLRAARAACMDADALLCTMKDWVKLEGMLDLDSWPVPVVVPSLGIDFLDGAEPLRELLAGVLEGIGVTGQPGGPR